MSFREKLLKWLPSLRLRIIFLGTSCASLSAIGEWLLFDPSEFYPKAYLLYILFIYGVTGAACGIFYSLFLILVPSHKSLISFCSRPHFFSVLVLVIFWISIASKLLLKAGYLTNLSASSFWIIFVALMAALTGAAYFLLSKALSAPLAKRISELPWLLKAGSCSLIILALIIYSFLPSASGLKAPYSNTEAKGRPSVILITVDTLRADYVSGYGLDITPRIKELSTDAVLFEKCFSPSPWTIPSHATLFTSLVPSSHGSTWIDQEESSEAIFRPLGEDIKTLAEVLKENGYITAAFIANGILFSTSSGMNQGFDDYFDNPHPYNEGLVLMPSFLGLLHFRVNSNKLRRAIERIDSLFIKMANYIYDVNYRWFPLNYENIHLPTQKGADNINHDVLKWIENNDNTPFFLFINYFEPHEQYIPHEGFMSDIIRGYKGQINYKSFPRGYSCRFMNDPSILSSSDIEYLKALYIGEVRFVDHHIGMLLNDLKKRGLYDDSLIILTSDHGESLGDHNLLNHGNFLYNELLHVPFLVKFPDNKYGGRRKTKLVGLIDVMPSLLKVIGIDSVKGMQGNDNMFDFSFSSDADDRFIAGEVYRTKRFINCDKKFDRDLHSLISSEWKIIEASNGTRELYNMVKDPGELLSVDSENPEVFQYLIDRLQEYFSDKRREGGDDILEETKKDIMEKLKALGYVN